MRTTIVLAIVISVALGVYALHERGQVVDLRAMLDAANQAREQLRVRCETSGLDSLNAVLSAAMRSRPAVQHSPTPTIPADAKRRDGGTTLENLPPDNQESFFKDIDDAKAKGAARRKEAIERARLSASQERDMDKAASVLNSELGSALDRLLALRQRGDKVRPREAVDIIADGLRAVQRADDDFRAGLSESQRAALDGDGFDITTQLDPMVIVGRILSVATVSPE